ncbi:hypothetical protein ABZ595_19190 [Streptomyces rubradiris]|uniref:hypothetical protein n=1 Tax=Streptomyces rubradiris TaxID=285531 RepID=UPI0033E472A1
MNRALDGYRAEGRTDARVIADPVEDRIGRGPPVRHPAERFPRPRRRSRPPNASTPPHPREKTITELVHTPTGEVTSPDEQSCEPDRPIKGHSGTSQAGAVHVADVALYRSADIDAIPASRPEVDWEQLRTVEQGRRSALAAPAKQAAPARPVSAAGLSRAKDKSPRSGVPMTTTPSTAMTNAPSRTRSRLAARGVQQRGAHPGRVQDDQDRCLGGDAAQDVAHCDGELTGHGGAGRDGERWCWPSPGPTAWRAPSRAGRWQSTGRASPRIRSVWHRA